MYFGIRIYSWHFQLEMEVGKLDKLELDKSIDTHKLESLWNFELMG